MLILCRSILSVALTAAFWTGASHASDGEAAYKARCGECHGPRDIVYWGQQRPDADARQVWLDQFLHRHYPPSDTERVAIISYIQSTIERQRAPR